MLLRGFGLALALGSLAMAAPLAAAEREFPGLRAPAMPSICDAWAHNENGREHGNAAKARPSRGSPSRPRPRTWPWRSPAPSSGSPARAAGTAAAAEPGRQPQAPGLRWPRVRLLGQDKRARSMTLRPDTLDDLWHLYNLVEAGDLVRATTRRTSEAPRDEGQGKARKRTLALTVKVERVEFHDFANRLRILGTIVGTEEEGKHHTLNIEPLDDLTIAKAEAWRDHHVERVAEAVRAGQRPLVVFVSIEDGEATLAVLRQYGLQEAGVIPGPGTGKRAGKEEDRAPWLGEIAAALRGLVPEGGRVLVVGPGFAKEHLMAWLKDKAPDLAQRCIVDSTSHAGIAGIREAMKRGLVDRVDKEARVALETRLVEKVHEAIGASEPVAYGEAEVARAVGEGAASLLLVTDRLVREGRAKAMLEQAKRTRCEAHVVSTGHEAGKRLESLGGCAALLRYALAPG